MRIYDLEASKRAYETACGLFRTLQNNFTDLDSLQKDLIIKATHAGIIFAYTSLKKYKLRDDFLRRQQEVLDKYKYVKTTGQFIVDDPRVESEVYKAFYEIPVAPVIVKYGTNDQKKTLHFMRFFGAALFVFTMNVMVAQLSNQLLI